MTLDEAFIALSGHLDDGHEVATQTLLDQWDEAKPRCLARVHAYVTGQDQSEATERSLFAVLQLLAEQEEPAVCADLCALARDPERIGLVLGDMVTDLLPAMLISCFDGNAALLEGLVKQVDGLVPVRDGALMALAFLTQDKRVSQADMQSLLVEAYDLFPPEPGYGCWVGWAHAVGLLGFGGLAARVQTLFDRKLIDQQFLTPAEFHMLLRQAKDEPGALDGFLDLGIGPMSFVLENLGSEPADYETPPPLPDPILNPLRHVGRNDPCPCGSGKKYKKCCLA